MTKRFRGALLAALLVVALVPGSASAQVRFVEDGGDQPHAMDIVKVRVQNGRPGSPKRVKVSTRVAVAILGGSSLTIQARNRAGTTYRAELYANGGESQLREYRNGIQFTCVAGAGGTASTTSLYFDRRWFTDFHRKCVGRRTGAVQVRSWLRSEDGRLRDRTRWSRWANVR